MTNADWVVVGLAACLGVYVYARLIREIAHELAQRRRNGARMTPHPDYMKIAVLEYELFGIRPRPGSAAEFAIGLQQAFGPRHEPRAVADFPPSLFRQDARDSGQDPRPTT